MCPFCKLPNARIIKKGFSRSRHAKAKRPQRYACKECRRRFSDRTFSLTYREKKPQKTFTAMRLLSSGVSQRRSAEILRVHRETVARKLCRLGTWTRRRHDRWLSRGKVGAVVVFDEMETFEHSKCKPLSIAIAVEEGSRRLIAAEVASMPAKGRLAKISVKRYGKRPDERPASLDKLADRIKAASPDLQHLKSDKCPRYPTLVKRRFPKVEHHQFKGRRGCVVGQGELKRGGFDPLFSLNHTCAMARDNLKRLSRKTWCTTKRPDRLQALLDVYIWAHNQRIIGRNSAELRL